MAIDRSNHYFLKLSHKKEKAQFKKLKKTKYNRKGNKVNVRDINF